MRMSYCLTSASIPFSTGAITHSPGIGMQLLANRTPRGTDHNTLLGSDLISGIDIQSTEGGCRRTCWYSLVNLSSSGASSMFSVQLLASEAQKSSENDSKFLLCELLLPFPL